ncbi:MAG: pyrroline-5-carboxylate reductase [Parvularculaceae bacterium]
MTDAPISLALVGAGKMGGALLRCWVRAPGLLDAKTSAIVDPDPSPAIVALAEQYGLRLNPPEETIAADVAVLAVKPQIIDAAARALRLRPQADALYLSIAAGKSLASLAEILPPGAAIIRAMPNLPAWVGKGVTALFANPAATDEQKAFAERLMAAAGAAIWVEEEAQIDMATAISGSGPAYVFYLAECLAGAGRSAGLSEAQAAEFARATVIGAGAMLEASDDPPAELRRAVTSPGGTTEAALKVLMEEPGGLASLMREATRAALARARELND